MTDTNEQMDPENSPGTVSKKTGVRRVNNVPMYIIGGLVGTFLLIMMMVAANRASNQNAGGPAEKEKAGSTVLFADEITGNHTEGIIAPAAPPDIPGMNEPGTDVVLIARPDLDAPPTPPRPPAQPAQPMDPEIERLRRAKLQILEEAAKSGTSVRFSMPQNSGSSGSLGGSTDQPMNREEMLSRIAAVRQQIDSTQNDDPTAVYQARLAQVTGKGLGGMALDGSATSSTTPSGSENSASLFDRGSDEDRWKLNSRPEAPGSPYELRAGFVVPATLISGINSELPGQIMGQVAQNVYDTPTGRHLLIPQGSRLVGSYSSDVAYGQSRVLVAWQRIVFPDGKAMDIGAMPGADSAGYSGFKDQVNNHYLRIFGSAVLMSGVVAGINLSQDSGTNGDDDSQRASDAMSEALGQQLGQVTAQMIAKNLNIAPTLEIRPGFRFNVIATKDLTFSKPYQNFDY